MENRRPVSYDVILNGKTVYSGVPAKAAPGEASILKLEETVKVRSVRIVPHDRGEADRLPAIPFLHGWGLFCISDLTKRRV